MPDRLLAPIASRDIPWGGVVGTITVHPRDANRIFIGTQNGGLYRSYNGGGRWGHLDDFPPYAIVPVSYCPSNPDIVLATTGFDTRTERAGGIWRSNDGGDSWTVPAGSVPPITDRWPERVSAYGLSWVPGTNSVWVATDCGLMRSDNLGETWTGPISVDPTGVGQPDVWDRRFLPDRMFSVLAISPTHLVAGGASGHYYTIDGSTWRRSVDADANIYGARGLAVAPGNPQLLFRADFVTAYLQYSPDGGVRWERFPQGGLDAGNQAPFLKTTSSARGEPFFELYYGDGTNLKRATLSATDISEWRNPSRTPWQQVTLAHTDPLDIGFHPLTGRPMLLVGDFGLQGTLDDGATWSNGASSAAGLTALDVYGLAVQRVDGPTSQTDVTFVTWHNESWYSGDRGRTWQRRGPVEGFSMRGSGPRLGSSDDALISVLNYGRTDQGYSWLARRGLTELASAYPPRASECGVHYVFYQHPAGNRPYVLAATYGCDGASVIYDQRDVHGTSWREVARRSEVMYGFPQIAVRDGTATLYHAFVNARGKRLLTRLSNIEGRTLTATPAMRGFGSIAARALPGNDPVFSVRPDNERMMIAVDDSAVQWSEDAAESWEPMDELTRLVTDDGRLRFATVGGRCQVTTIAYDPYDPSRVLVGTMQAGVLASWDSGRTWAHIPDSDRVSQVVAFGFDRSGDVYVATCGRGLWKWAHSLINPPLDLYPWLVNLLRDPMTGTPVPIECVFDAGCCPACVQIIARRGAIRNLKVSPETNEAFVLATDPDAVLTYVAEATGLSLTVLQATDNDTPDPSVWPAWAKETARGNAAKVVVLSGAKLLGYIAARLGQDEIPTKVLFAREAWAPYKPSLQLEGVTTAPGYDIAPQGGKILLTGVGFSASEPSQKRTTSRVTVYLDGSWVIATADVDTNGTFRVPVQLRTAPGDAWLQCVQETAAGRLVVERKLLVLNLDGMSQQ
jgi:hypothetical protein